MDYGDVIYDQSNNSTLSDKIESVQYNAALAITGAIRGTSREKLYQELGLDDYVIFIKFYQQNYLPIVMI